mmetsp:Transcript_50076/g.100847  ORF Transcript_50076/g.100847 Transcript_50076/m.100847 type:complete len:111 (-) Transcript_50076:201-533(-)|eukprot:CAMPEP_0113824470 /NCGR_PEP_ID=MMETSP0328-20130328/3258_1 /TAXON_ID=39455 /ORGANISM="Alexandrium minutum" /LENGTH=110 /DNA_ID=CAMNT_0000792409 /DNA_START=99 /DNA_END=431 /DNA_ORIENTATION=+ /assembly_acc=CAM_ASM_000350
MVQLNHEIEGTPESEADLLCEDGSVWITGVKLKRSEYKCNFGTDAHGLPQWIQINFKEVADITMQAWAERISIRHTDQLDAEKLTQFMDDLAKNFGLTCEYVGTVDSPVD